MSNESGDGVDDDIDQPGSVDAGVIMADAASPSCVPTWTHARVVDVARSPSFVIDSRGHHLAYSVSSGHTGNLMYTAPSGSHAVTSFGGSVIAVAIDSGGAAHVAYTISSAAGSQLRYAYKSAAGSPTTPWADVQVADSVRLGDYSQRFAIATDAANEPHIAMIDGADGQVTIAHAFRAAGVWTRETIDSYASTQQGGPRIAILGDTIQVAYPTGSGPARLAIRDAASWTQHPFPSGTSQAVSLVLTADGASHVLYDRQQTGPDALIYGVRSPQGAWTEQVVDTWSVPPSTSSLAIDSDGGLHVTYALPITSTTKAHLRYAHRPPTGAWEILTFLENRLVGLFENTVTVDADGVHIVHMSDNTNQTHFGIDYRHRCL